MNGDASSLNGFAAALLIPFLISLAGTGFAIPLAKRAGILDAPGDYKVHAAPMPRFGGLGIVLGVVITASIWSGANLLLLGGLAVAITGAIDDRFTIGPYYKIAGELVSGLMLALYIWTGPEGASGLLLGGVAIILVLGFSNAVNLLDGLNGLAAGTSLISISGLAYLLQAQERTPVLALITAGALAGFLLWNFPVARTFMGDNGSLFIGFVIAALLTELARGGPLIFLIGILVTGVPVFDTSVGIIRRLVHRQPLFSADRGHFYDVMNQRIGSPTSTVLIIYAMNILLVAGGIMASLTGYIGAIIIFCLAAVFLAALSRALALI